MRVVKMQLLLIIYLPGIAVIVVLRGSAETNDETRMRFVFGLEKSEMSGGILLKISFDLNRSEMVVIIEDKINFLA